MGDLLFVKRYLFKAFGRKKSLINFVFNRVKALNFDIFLFHWGAGFVIFSYSTSYNIYDSSYGPCYIH